MKKYRTFIIVTILICIGLVYFYKVTTDNSKKPAKNKEAAVTEVDVLINKDLEKNYPKTPREVVKLYSRIVKSFYDGGYDDNQKKALALQARLLFDEELLSKNPFDKYYESLSSDIEAYKKAKQTISTYIIENASDVEYKSFQSQQYAQIKCVYYIKGKKGTTRTIEKYTLRKDESGNWKILFWKIAPVEEENE